MSNDITSIINLHSDQIKIDKTEITTSTKLIYISKIKVPMFCPICGTRMHSKGITVQRINHPVLQDGYQLILILNKRRWYCQNDDCRFYQMDEFPFAMRYQHNSNITPLLILKELKCPTVTMRDIADRFHVSDTFVHTTMLRYVNPKRLPLPKILSVDEVFMDIDYDSKYVLVLMNFETGEIIDLLPSRRKETYEDYFLHIPLEERNAVEFLVCDMYNPYVNFTVNYFRKAKPIIDSFHVQQWINHRINQYINEVKKRYLKRDKQRLDYKNTSTNNDFKSTETSKEVYLLNHYAWVILRNKEFIDYSTDKHWNRKLHQYLDTYDYESIFLSLDPNFKEIRKLKELYVSFNHLFPLSKENATKKLFELISIFSQSSFAMFKDFAELLERYMDPITNSFIDTSTYIEDTEIEMRLRRISNGPIESFNRLPKDLKRNARGFTNFDAIRTRILWINRPNEPILSTPRSEKEIHNYTSIKRGPYSKQNK